MDCQVCGEFRGHGHECKIPAPEWRELGPDEERVQGEFSSQNPPMFEKCKVCGEEYGFHSGGKWDAFCRRTKRPLPVREEMPMDTLWTQVLLHRKDKNGDMADAFGSIYDCIRYLRDEITKLKEAR